MVSQVVLVVKNLSANVGDVRDMGSILGWGGFSEGGHGNPLQYSCLENPMDRWSTRSQNVRHGSSNGAHKYNHRCFFKAIPTFVFFLFFLIFLIF